MRRIALLSAVSLAAMVAAPAYAQTASADEDESVGVGEILVTAQRRTENVQDVPIAITALGSEQLETRGVSNALQVAQFVPNLTAMNNTGLGTANAYYLRGLGSTETIPTFDPPVGTYVDEIYLSRQNANNLSLFDVERVEVLRGPQGTLFGRNTTGGAVSIVMRQPGNEFGGYIEAGLGRWDQKMVRGSVDIPLAPSFSVKLSGYWQDDDGYVQNVTTGETLNDNDGWGVRLGLRGELSPSVTWTASYTHVVSDGENILNFECNPLNRSICDGRYASTGLRQNGATPPFSGLVISGRKANYDLGNETDTDLVTSKLDIGIGDFGTLSLITGYLYQSQQYNLDFFDGRGSAAPSITNPFPTVLQLPRGGFTFLADQQSNQITQEIKLSGSSGPLDYVAGFYYLKENVRNSFADILGTTTGAGALVLADRLMRNSTEALAGYAQFDLNLGALKLTAGIRYTDETKELSFIDLRPTCAGVTLPATCLVDANMIVPANGTTVLTTQIIPRKLETGIWTPRFAINFKPSDDLLLYASATRGFKSGGWNARETSPGRILPFGPERVWSYEAGFKSELFDRRVRFNMAVFQIDVTDLQTLSASVNPATGGLSFITRNFADYRNRGVEAEFTFAPAPGLDLFANFGYSDDEYILKTGVPQFDIYGIQSVEAQLAACRAALAAGKVAGGPNTPATLPSIANCGAGIVDPQGNLSEPVRTPDWTISFGGSYRAELGGGWGLTPSVAAIWRSEMEVGTSNVTIFTGTITGTNGTFANNLNSGDIIFGSRSKAAWLVNAGIALTGPDERIRLSVDCTNCFDETMVQSALGNYTYLNQPMSWQVRMRYKF